MSKSKIAVFHAFLQNKGGAEKVVIDICRYYGADLFVGGVRSDLFNKNSPDSFSQAIFHEIPSFTPLHEDSKLFGWKHIKRQLYFLFSPKVKQLEKYDLVIFSGNIASIPTRIKSKGPKIITYCHTPPRPFTDQKHKLLKRINPILRPLYEILSKLVIASFKKGLLESNEVISNSINIQKRLKKYVGVDSIPIYPPINTTKFQYNKPGDYYLSHSRLEEIKRIPLIIEAFKKLPDKQLIICSTGPLKEWVEKQIEMYNLSNIEYRGLVSDAELEELVGSCKAGIVIPEDEDAGITQCEIMAAGKPVLGVREGGLLETVVHKKTGYLIPANPGIEDLVEGIQWLEAADTDAMKTDCIKQGKKFDRQVFFDKMTEVMSNLSVTV